MTPDAPKHLGSLPFEAQEWEQENLESSHMAENGWPSKWGGGTTQTGPGQVAGQSTWPSAAWAYAPEAQAHASGA